VELISIGKFAQMVGVTATTLRRMHAKGDLIPAHVSKGGTRYYSKEQLKDFAMVPAQGRNLVIGYCRVSTPAQKDDLQTQVENVRTYMYAKGYQFEIITDIGSGINYKKKGLRQLIDKIDNREISKIVVLYKDRLIRFGYEMLEYFCSINGVEIEIIDHKEHSKEQELTDDLIQIITVFANRLYGSRSKKAKHLIDEVKQNAKSSQNQVEANA